ncbi:MAG: adenylate/guanylate cyclase domain-containing protein [Hyphomicrobiales bacterium]
MPTERRLAAILAADVVGYSRLMGADEIGTLRALKAMRAEILDPMIARYRGRIVKTTGDGLLVEFASVVDAVACAVAVQHGMGSLACETRVDAPLQLRIGVNIGDIIIDGSDIFGDGVNIAARLESLCEPGGLAVSRAVHEQVRDKLAFRFADLGEQSVKNIARPLRVFAIGREAMGTIPATALPKRSDPSPSTPVPATAPATEAPRPRWKAWRRRVILVVVAAFVLSRIGPVRHAIDALFTLGAPAPATAPTKPAQLAPLPPPIVVPSPPAPADTPASAEPATDKPIELHPKD